jgi:hypothetical protein
VKRSNISKRFAPSVVTTKYIHNVFDKSGSMSASWNGFLPRALDLYPGADLGLICPHIVVANVEIVAAKSVCLSMKNDGTKTCESIQIKLAIVRDHGMVPPSRRNRAIYGGLGDLCDLSFLLQELP